MRSSGAGLTHAWTPSWKTIPPYSVSASAPEGNETPLTVIDCWRQPDPSRLEGGVDDIVLGEGGIAAASVGV